MRSARVAPAFAAALAGVALMAGTPVAAQTGPGAAARSPFPAERVVAVPGPAPGTGTPAPAVPPHAAITDLSVARPAPGVAPDVVIRFAEPFTPPAGYQLSVFVGDPQGPRLRASLLPAAGATPAPAARGGGVAVRGALAGGDGRTWTDLGPTAAELDGLGFAIITVPLTAAPAGPLVWVEASDASSPTPVRTTPVVSRAALFGEGDPAVLPTPPVGQVRDASGAWTGYQTVGAGPTLTVRDGALVVAYPADPAPAPEAAGADREVDTVRLAVGYSGAGRRSAEVRINRRTGDVKLFETPGRGAGPAGVEPPPGSTDRTGDRSWVRGGLAAEGRTVERLTLDLAALGWVLGTELAPAGTAFSVGRTLRFPDGRTVATDTVYATVASLDQGATPPPTQVEPPAPPAPPPSPPEPGVAPAAVAAGAATVVLLLLVVALVVRRRRRRARLAARYASGGEDRVPWAATDGHLTHEAEQERFRIVTAELPVVPEGDDLEAEGLALADTGAPVVADLAVGGRRRRGRRSRREAATRVAGSTPAAGPAAGEAGTVQPPAARQDAPAAGGNGAPDRPRPSGPVPAGEVLAALDDEVAGVRARLAELGPAERPS